MSNRIADARKLRASMVASATGASNPKVTAKATAKGQRSALTNGQDKRSVQATSKRDVWSAPNVTFADVCEGLGLEFKSLADAQKAAKDGMPKDTNKRPNAKAVQRSLDALKALDAYSKTKQDAFDLPFSFADFDRLVRREIASERAGGLNLGLAGYSPDDVIQLAVVDAWSRSVCVNLLKSHALTAGDAEQLRIALTRYSLADMADAVTASEFTRYSVEFRTNKAGEKVAFIRTLDARKKVAKTLKAKATIERLIPQVKDVYAMQADFSIGDVYKAIKRVKKQGVKAIRQMLEGHSPSGVFTDNMLFGNAEKQTIGFRSAVNGNLQDALTASLEGDFFKVTYSVQDERADLIEALKATSLVPAQAEALVFVELLNKGYSIAELKQVFEDLTAQRFGAMVQEAQRLFK